MDRKIKQGDAEKPVYTIFSIWDTFRALHPLMTIIEPQLNDDYLNSLLLKAEEGGVLPKWELAANYTGTMIGYHAASLFADAVAKGQNSFDVNEALKASVRAAEYDTAGIACPPKVLPHLMPMAKYYKNTLGYIPSDKENESVAKALEYAYDDWCISQLAKAAATPAWVVSQDVPGLINLMGGPEKFTEKLDSLFSASSELTGDLVSADITGLIGQYAQGNEPSHHIIHLYNYAGQPWKTQELIDRVFEEQYRVDPDGLSGNEDCGQMSAWFVMNAMGIYQVCPGEPVYSIGRPLFETASFNLPGGKRFTVTAKNFSKENKYIKSATLNGKPLEKPFFTHDELANGGELVLEMSGEPTQWGAGK